MYEIIYFNCGRTGSVKADTIQAAIDLYYKRRKTGAGWGHYFVNGERVWV